VSKNIFLRRLAKIATILDNSGHQQDANVIDQLLLKFSQSNKEQFPKGKDIPKPYAGYKEPDFNYKQIYQENNDIIFPLGTSADVIRDAIELQMDEKEKNEIFIDTVNKKVFIPKEIIEKYQEIFKRVSGGMNVDQIPEAPQASTQNSQIQQPQNLQQPQKPQKTQNLQKPPSKKEPTVPNIKKAPRSQFEINPSDTGATLPKDMIFQRTKEKNYKYDTSFNQVIQQAINNNLSVREMYQDLYNKNPNYANNLIAYFRTIAPYKNPNDKIKELWNK
jgi:hypothetical protein